MSLKFTTAILFLFTFAFNCLPASAQYNTTLLGHIDYIQTVNDVWGYAANGHEYALLGTRTGTAIIDVTDPTNPTELFFVPGPSSLWRDMKVWGHHAYVTNETDSGLHVFDLQYLPDSIHVSNWMGGVFQGATINMNRAHNIFIDEQGIGYILGSNVGVGGALIIDLTVDPENPPIVGLYNEHYCHDVFVRGDTLWTAEIYAGQFSVVDVSDKENPIVMATQPTPFAFTHNCWLSDDGNTFITTDEKSNAPIGIFDVSDISDIKQVAEYRSNPGSGVIPHNTFFHNNFIVTSYYRDGARITDATYPSTPIEVGYYDTSPLFGDNFNGCWGVYPYLPSGILLASDMEEGLFVIGASYTPACYLQGSITNAMTGTPLSGAQVAVAGLTAAVTTSGFTGAFQTGMADAGVYTVTVSLYGYETQTFEVVMVNGVVTPLIVALQPVPSYQVTLYIKDADTGVPLANAEVLFQNAFVNETVFTNAYGVVTVLAYEPGIHDIYIGKWGYRTMLMSPFVSSTNNLFFISLTPGYYDDFFFEFGWTVGGDATSGEWELVKPIGSTFAGMSSNVAADVATDFGDYCFVTGNGGSGIVNNVNDGTTLLTSPAFDLTGYTNPELRYYRYLALQDGSNDTLRIQISNGIETVTVEEVRDGDPFEYGFHQSIANISALLQPTDNMHLIVSISDNPTSGHVVEAAFDLFEVVEGVSPEASFTAANNLMGCSTHEVQFVSTSTAGTDLTWSFPGGVPSVSTSSTPTVTYNSPGTYSVTLTATNAFGTDEFTFVNYVTVYPSPNLSIVTPANICQSSDFVLTGDSVTLLDSSFWTGNGVINPTEVMTFVNVNLPGLQTYTLTMTDVNGCTDTESVTVDVQPAPQFNAFASEDTVCVGSSITLQADEGEYNYTWMGGDNIFTPLLPNYGFVITTASFTSDNTYYTATATNPVNGCQTSHEVLVTVIDAITGIVAPTSVCAGEEVTLSVTGDMATFSGWVWRKNGEILPDTSPTITTTITSTTTFSAQITTAGCTDMETVTVDVLPMPMVEAFALGLFIDFFQEGQACWGVPFDLRADYPIGTPPFTHLWEGEGVQDPEALNTTAIYEGTEDTVTYYFTITSADNCQETLEVNVVMNPIGLCILDIDETEFVPLFTLQPNPTDNGSFTISANLPASTEPVLVEVFNVLGQTVWQEEIVLQGNTLNHVVQLPNYSPGMYWVRLNTSGNQYSSPLICR